MSSDNITVQIPDDDNVMYINGNTLAEIITGEKHTDNDVIIQIPIIRSDEDLKEFLEDKK